MPLELARANHDSSWLIRYRNGVIVLDPWLLGSNIDFGSWFSHQDHTSPVLKPSELISLAGESAIVVISHQFTDHFSRETLLELPRDWEAFAEPKWAAPKVCSLGHFGSVTPICEKVNSNNQSLPRYPLGSSGLRVSFGFFRANRLTDVLHNALLVQFYPDEHAEEAEDSLLYCPHGVFPRTAAEILSFVRKPLSALICTISEYHIPAILGGQLNLGLDAAIGVAENLNARSILDSHSENKTKEGIVGRFSRAVAPDHATAAAKCAAKGIGYVEVNELGKWIQLP